MKVIKHNKKADIFICLFIFILIIIKIDANQERFSLEIQQIQMSQIKIQQYRQYQTPFLNYANLLSQQQCHCEHNGTCSKQVSQYCICPQNYIGKKCQQSAFNITQQKIQTKIYNNDKYVYFFYTPTQENYYYMKLNICILKGINQKEFNSNPLNNLYVDIQGKDQSFNKIPINSLTANFSASSKQDGNCGILTVPLFLYQKKNDEHSIQRLIIGIKMQPLSRIQQKKVEPSKGNPQQQQLNNKQVYQQISISCYGQVFLSSAFWWALIIAFISIFIIMLIFSIIVCIRHRLLQRNIQNGLNNGQQQDFNIDHFEKVMPSVKYSTLTEQGQLPHEKQLQSQTTQEGKQKQDNNNINPSINDNSSISSNKQSLSKKQKFSSIKVNNKKSINKAAIQCAICLAQIQDSQLIRKTLCKHIFHQECLDKWCIKHINCPICRGSLSKSQIEIKLKQISNVRAPMLQNQHQ